VDLVQSGTGRRLRTELLVHLRVWSASSRNILLGVTVCAAIAVIVVVVALQASSDDEPEPASIIGALAQPQAVTLGETLGSLQVDSIRHLASHEGVEYFIGLRDDDRICLVARQGAVEASSCREASLVQRSGVGLDVQSRETTRVTAYLIPDGYSDDASTLPWATLVAPNLLVVSDLERMPSEEVTLTSSHGDALTLIPIAKGSK